MPTANEQILDDIIEHQVNVLRYANREADEMNSIIDADLVLQVGALLSALDGIQSGFYTKSLNNQIDRAVRSVSRLRQSNIKDAEKYYRSQMSKFITHEIGVAEGVLIDSMPIRIQYDIPNLTTTKSRILNNGSWQGGTFLQWFQSVRTNDASRVSSSIRSGVTQGLTGREIVRSTLGTRRFGYADGAVSATRNDINRLSRTVTNGIAVDARSEFYAANSDIIKQELYVATLDGRTTLLCISLDGNVYDVGKGPQPPVHHNCRSTRTPLVDIPGVMDLIGDRPFVRDTQTRKQREVDFRKIAKSQKKSIQTVRKEWSDRVIGSVPAKVTYEQWLKRQPTAFQNEVLGPARAKLWRSGKVKIDRFVDRSGKKLTLDELKLTEG